MLGLMREPKCCQGGGCAPEDARGAGAASPSPLGALGVAPEAARPRVPGGPAAGPALPLLPSAVPGALGRERLPGGAGTARRSPRRPQQQQVRGLGRSRPPQGETRIVLRTRGTCRGHEPGVGGRGWGHISAPRYRRSLTGPRLCGRGHHHSAKASESRLGPSGRQWGTGYPR